MPDSGRRDTIRKVAERALSASRAPETEVLLTGGTESLTRFAGSVIHQNVTREDIEISIRVADGGRTGRASTNRTSEEALVATAARALEIARRLEPQPGLLPVPDPFASYPTTRCWDAGTAAASPETRARMVARIVDAAASRDLSAAGSVTSDDKFESVANSRGLFAYGEYTASVLSTTMTGPDSTGYAEDGAFALGRLEPQATALRAADKATRSARPEEIPPGEYEAILEPAAVGELLIYLLYGGGCSHFSGQAVQEGRSFFTGRLGQKVFGENVTLRDTLENEAQWGVPFDAEGVPKQPMTLVEKGVVRALTYDRAAAAAAGKEPTGHGLPVPNTLGSFPQNVVLDGGTTSVDEMIRTTRRGILITRLWYNRLVDPAELIVTGLTRDGTFLVEDGKIVKGLRNYRFNQSIRSLLNQVTALSPARRAGTGIVAPALKVQSFRLSSVVPRDPQS